MTKSKDKNRLPQPVRDFVGNQDESRGSGTPAESVQLPICEDLKRQTHDRLQSLLLEGRNSGEPIEITPEYWEHKRAQLIERHSQNQDDAVSVSDGERMTPTREHAGGKSTRPGSWGGRSSRLRSPASRHSHTDLHPQYPDRR